MRSTNHDVTPARDRLTIAEPTEGRDWLTVDLDGQLVIVGGGMSGTCAAITAARAGVRVVLLQDRPVLGGNASSEVRLWVLGATAHQRNNNRFAREGGVIDEVLVENAHRNPEGNPVIFDTILLEKVVDEPNITLLLNTALIGAETDADRRISRITAFCSQNSTRYEITAPLFMDASGDGALAFLAGAGFRMGAESRGEFGEPFAPSDDYGHLLGHSLFFYAKDAGHPVRFTAPSFALRELGSIPETRHFGTEVDGCQLWWIEWGGRLDTIHETETIKWKLWQVVYGVWDHLKNSGDFPDAENLTLEWVGSIPGKRESRRFEGHHMLTQQDVVGRAQHADAVAFGGWAIDLHPADGVFAEGAPFHHLHTRGTYQIPFRSLVARDVDNLLLAGRIISATHVAFGSTRVMATGAHVAQAGAVAAALCLRDGLQPSDLFAPERMAELQRELLRRGQHIPQLRRVDPDDLAAAARITASTELALADLPVGGETLPLERDHGQLLPLPAGPVPVFGLRVDAAEATTLRVQLRRGLSGDDYTPDQVLAEREVSLVPGTQDVSIDFATTLDEAAYAVLATMQNPHVAVHTSDRLVTGLIPLVHFRDQAADPSVGRPAIEFWAPIRRPEGRNLALTIDPPLALGPAAAVADGLDRPTDRANAWIADPSDPAPALRLEWDAPQRIGRIELRFDTDFDHARESVLIHHPEIDAPFCARDLEIRADGRVIARIEGNHQSARSIVLDQPVEVSELTVAVQAMAGAAPATLFTVSCYADPDDRLVR